MSADPIPGQQDDEARFRRDIVTPEGVRLTVQIAPPVERLSAALLDFLMVFFASSLIGVAAAALQPDEKNPSTSMAWAELAMFLLPLLYYPSAELYFGGQTLGKRALGLRVIERSGAGLSVNAVIARTLMREIELWQPLMLLLSLGLDTRTLLPTHLATAAWLLALTSIPLFNRDVMRAGDMIAGTWVVVEPAGMLLEDLSGSASAAAATPFTREQLAIYGIHELETLATVLRDGTPNAARLQEEVARRIQRKINWLPGTGVDPPAFLRAYYIALRRHLEKELLFGRRRLSKFDARIH